MTLLDFLKFYQGFLEATFYIYFTILYGSIRVYRTVIIKECQWKLWRKPYSIVSINVRTSSKFPNRHSSLQVAGWSRVPWDGVLSRAADIAMPDWASTDWTEPPQTGLSLHRLDWASTDWTEPPQTGLSLPRLDWASTDWTEPPQTGLR